MLPSDRCFLPAVASSWDHVSEVAIPVFRALPRIAQPIQTRRDEQQRFGRQDRGRGGRGEAVRPRGRRGHPLRPGDGQQSGQLARRQAALLVQEQEPDRSTHRPASAEEHQQSVDEGDSGSLHFCDRKRPAEDTLRVLFIHLW